jgi:hypothetical protein
VESAEFSDELVTGAKEEVIGVSENDGGMEIFGEVTLGEPFDGGLCAYGHEDRGGNVAVFGVEDSRASAGYGTFGLKLKGDLAGQISG